MSEREFWVEIRRGLVTILDAIEKKQQLGKYAPKAVIKPKPITKAKVN